MQGMTLKVFSDEMIKLLKDEAKEWFKKNEEELVKGLASEVLAFAKEINSKIEPSHAIDPTIFLPFFKENGFYTIPLDLKRQLSFYRHTEDFSIFAQAMITVLCGETHSLTQPMLIELFNRKIHPFDYNLRFAGKRPKSEGDLLIKALEMGGVNLYKIPPKDLYDLCRRFGVGNEVYQILQRVFHQSVAKLKNNILRNKLRLNPDPHVLYDLLTCHVLDEDGEIGLGDFHLIDRCAYEPNVSQDHSSGFQDPFTYGSIDCIPRISSFVSSRAIIDLIGDGWIEALYYVRAERIKILKLEAELEVCKNKVKRLEERLVKADCCKSYKPKGNFFSRFIKRLVCN